MNQNSQSADHSLPHDLERQVESVCQQFERAWRARENPAIERFAERVAPTIRAAVIRELIIREVEFRDAAGEELDAREYHNRFPQHAADIHYAFNRVLQPTRDESTVSWQQPQQIPDRIGRFILKRKLGAGGFGEVYLATDSELGRDVALKLAKHSKFRSDAERQHLIQEARTAAKLDHPRIVAIYDVCNEQDQLFIVQQYVEGRDLRTELKTERPAFKRAAELISTVTETIGFAHRKGFVHRDLKPANIFLDNEGSPHVADFGLAIHESVQRRRRGERSGTPAYMSPELARGETHRLDGRSDIWSLGVVFYQMLTGKFPFDGKNAVEVFDEIQFREPIPPRQIDPQIPTELERICLKCIEKRSTDRYPTTADLAEDLQQWLVTSETGVKEVNQTNAPIIPRGLRSFGVDDQDFFLKLLPGPRDRNGFPDSIAFWKSRIEGTPDDKTFDVGLIYGPSGCGKSSLVKAGLLPHLRSNVISVYVECTSLDTEVRILNGLRRRFGEISDDLSLGEVLESLRHGHWLPGDKKLLIVLDQFEQWLHGRDPEQYTQLVNAIRQCDGKRLQCILMVRDDFWLATSRFLHALEVDLLEGQNTMLVDLFDPFHARWVLYEFGHAYGRLPENPQQATQEQNEFLDQSIEELAEGGKVICVRLALFAEMFKGRDWTPSALKLSGGTEGVGVTFLEETFSEKYAPPEHRLHERAARAVLAKLLPASGTIIRGNMQSYEELLFASGYTSRPDKFKDLVRILDQELRLITPTDPEGVGPASDQPNLDRDDQTWYQLTHDYLVRPLRQWLTRKQQETMRGRAELRLSEHANDYRMRPAKRNLPAAWKCLNILALTNPRNWSKPESEMMKRAGRLHGLRMVFIVTLLVVVALVAPGLYGRFRAAGLFSELMVADTSEVPLIVEKMSDYRRWVDPRLTDAANDQPVLADPKKQLHISLARLPVQHDEMEYVFGRMLVGTAVEKSSIANIARDVTQVVDHWQKEFEDLSHKYEQDNSRAMCKNLATVGAALVAVNRSSSVWPLLDFSPDPTIRSYLIEELGAFDVDPEVLMDRLDQEHEPGIRAALLLSMGQNNMDPVDRSSVLDRTEEIYRKEDDPGLHGAAEWLLRKLDPGRLVALRTEPRDDNPSNGNWYINNQGQTMVRVAAAGQPVRLFDPYGKFSLKHFKSDFFMSNTEVTHEQFLKFDKNHARPQCSPTNDCPVTQVSWYQAAKYCNWLSEQEGLDESDWCYVPAEQNQTGNGLRLAENYMERKGYRLPTAQEWIFACWALVKRGQPSWSCGRAEEMLPHYAWFRINSGEEHPLFPVGTRKPNQFGIFDMHGNAQEMRTPDDITLTIQGESCYFGIGGYCHDAAVTLRSTNAGSTTSSEPMHTKSGFRVLRLDDQRFR